MSSPHESIYLERRDKNRKSVPIFRSNKICAKLSCPRICQVLRFGVFWANRAVNMVSQFVEKHVSKDAFPYELNSKRHALHSRNDFVHTKLDVRRIAA